MSTIRVCFLGTPDFAAQHLQALLDDDHFEVVGVVTQPDRPSGRKMQLTPSPVKQLAEKNNLQVLTPENLKKDEECLAMIRSWKTEVAVVVAYGQILPQSFLDSFRFGAVNVHGSLLPLYRGAAPIQRSLENGDAVTGVSLQKMVFKLDAGPIIAERVIELDDVINATELYAQMAKLGCELLHLELMDYLRGNLAPRPQDEESVTLAHKISKEESLLDWNQSAQKLHNKVRAFSMGPGTYILQGNGKRLKIHKTKVVVTAAEKNQGSGKMAAGQIIQVDTQNLFIQCGENILALLEVQPESKAKMPVQEFLKVHTYKLGDRL